MAAEVLDVLLIRAHDDGPEFDREETNEVGHLMNNRVSLSSDGTISLGWSAQLPTHKEILHCCLPAWNWQGESGFHPTLQFSTHHALINSKPANPDDYNWDRDQRIREYVALSRIVHPSATSFDYCARLTKNDEAGWNIIPSSTSQSAYTSSKRTFLRLDEWRQTAILVEKWQGVKSLAARIVKALWWREKTAQEYFPRTRWPSLVTAIESLIKIWGQRRFGSTENFVRGMLLFAQELRVNYTEQDARLSYDIRSRQTHGGEWPMHSIRKYNEKNGQPVQEENLNTTVIDLYDRTEALLDGALKKSIEDDQFRSIFLDDAILTDRLDRAK